MVLSKLITSLMRKFLSPFVEDFNAEQLNIFGWSGQFTLSNVNIKPNAFDALRLPFRVTSGFIGQIEAQVPWMNIYTEPIVIKISDVYAVIVPNTEVDYNEAEERDYEWQLKKSHLENIELIKQKLEQEADSSKQEDDGFFMKLVTAAIKNIQIFISNVHICYEDNTSCRKPFQIGLAFSRLIFETENNKSNGKNSTNGNLINKIIKLEGFAFYLNHLNVDRHHGRDRQIIQKRLKDFFTTKNGADYVLCPIHFYNYAQIDRKPESSNYKYPIFDLDMHLDDFHIQLDNNQMHALLLLLDAIDRLKTASLYRKWRPKNKIKDNARLWWKFLYVAISETGVRRRRREFSWHNIEQACRRRKAYTEMYKRKLLGQKVDQELEELEKQLNLVVIVMARADAELATKKILKAMEKEKSGGWFKGWWSSGKKESEKESFIEDLKKEFTEGEEKEKLYKAIGYEENALSMIYPPDYVAYRLQFKIKRFDVTFKSGQKNIAVVELDNFSFGFKSRPCTGNIIIRNTIDSVKITGTNDVFLMRSTVNQNFLNFTFEMNPLDRSSDFAISLEMKSLHFLYDIMTVNQLYKLFAPPEHISLDEIKSAAQYRLDDLRLVTYGQVQNAIEKHKQVKLSIKVEPSFVIVPRKAQFDKANFLLLVSLGEFSLTSKLVPKSNEARLSETTNQEEMKQLIYETYTCHVKNVQVVLSNRQHWENDIEQLDTERHILCPFEIIMNFKRSIIGSDPRFPKIDLDGYIPSIELKASDTQISQILILLATLPYGPTIEEVDQSNDFTDKGTTSKISAIDNQKNKPILVTDEVIDAMNYAAKTVTQINKMKQEEIEATISNEVIDSKETIMAYKEVVFGFKLKKINLVIYRKNRQESSKLTRFQLVQLAIYGEMLSDKTLWINCSVYDLRIDDIRPQRKPNGIFTMLSKSRQIEDKDTNTEEEKSMVTVYMAQKINERIVIFSMSEFSLILAVDYILALLDITTKAFSMDDEDSEIKLTSDSKLKKFSVQTLTNQQKVSKDMKTKMMIECSLKKMEVIMLESLDVSNCEAGVFNFSSKISLKMEQDVIILNGYISKIKMALTNYLNYVESGHLEVYIMAPTNLTIIGSIKGTTQMLDFTFDDIYINISPSMVQTILNLLSAMGNNPEEKPKEDNANIDLKEILEPKKIDRKIWYLNYAPQAKDALSLLQPLDGDEQKSNLIFNMEKITILIKSGGLEAHPLIKIQLSTFAKLIDNKNFNFECAILSDYYNHSNSSWEPLIEPVDNKVFAFRGNVSLGETKNIQVYSMENLEVVLTKSSVNVLYNINEAFTQVIKTKSSQMIELNRVIIKNELGVDILVLLDKSNIMIGEPSSSKSKLPIKSINQQSELLMHSGKEYQFHGKDMNNVRLHLNLIFSETIIVERTILCQKNSTRCYHTSIKSYPMDEAWKFIVQVNDSGSTKEILIRSNTEITNQFDNSFEMFTFQDENNFNYLGKIVPHSTFYLPISVVYGEEIIYVKPSDDYELCTPPLLWRNTREMVKARKESHNFFSCNNSEPVKPYLILSCVNKKSDNKKFQIKIRGEKKSVLYEDTDKMDNVESFIHNVKMIPLAKLRNLLPYDVEFAYSPLNEKHTLKPGEEINLAFIKFGHSVIKFQILSYLGLNWIGSQEIPMSGSDVSTSYCVFKSNAHDYKITLPIEFRVENSMLSLSIYSPFWVINRTHEKIRFKVDEFHSYIFNTNMKNPQMFSYDPDKVTKKSKISLAISDSEFSTHFSVDVAPYKTTLTPKVPGQKYSYLVTVQVESSRIGLTKMIIVEPFYSIVNLTKQRIQYSENNEDWFSVDSNNLMPFYPKKLSNQSICFRLLDSEYDSKHVSLRESSQTLLLVDKKLLFVEVDVTELESKIRISEYFDGAAPVLIVNSLKHAIYYGQRGVSDWQNHRHIKVLPPEHMVYFCWIDPYQTRQLVYKRSLNDDEEIPVNIDFDTFIKFNEENYTWVSFLNGKQRILLFTKDMTLPENLLMTHEFIKPDMTFELIIKGFGLNIVDDELRQDLMYLSIKSKNMWESRNEGSKTFKAVSIKENDILENMYQHYQLTQCNSRASVIKSDYTNYEANFDKMILLKPRQSQLKRISNRGLWVSYSSSEHVKNVHVRINEIQIDNQLSDHVYDVVFSPVVVPKSISDKFDIERKNFIELCAIICPGSINRYKHIQILVQEFMLQIDLGWIFKISNVFNIKPQIEDSNKELIKNDLDDIKKYDYASELQKYVINKSYYDFIMFGPIKLHLSINISNVTESGSFFLLDLIVRMFGNVAEISDTLFKLDYFERKLLFMGQQELIKQLTDHYKNQALMQFYKVILGLDIIGNPMKLALGFKKGIGDFFYEPAAGIIHGPGEFAEGLATGARSFASNVLGGTAGALGRIGNRIGTGVATLTIDEKFQKNRRERINKKANFAESGKNLFKGIFSGITGVVTKPIEGAKEEGFEGLFKGVTKGVVGAIAQPATSVIDFASGSLQAFNEAIDPNKVAKPMRMPRPFNKNEIKPYCHQEAKGYQLLHSVSTTKFTEDDYVYHTQIGKNSVILLTNLHIIYLKQAFISNQWELEWYEPWSNCDETYLDKEMVIHIKLKATKKNFILNPLESPKERTIMLIKSNNSAISNNDHQHIQALFQRISSMASSNGRNYTRLSGETGGQKSRTKAEKGARL